MDTKTISHAVAKVTGLYRSKFGGLEPLTVTTPLTGDEVRRNPIFYELDLNPDLSDENLIIDVIYDNLSPLMVQDLRRGTDIRGESGSGRTGSKSHHMRRCTTLTVAGCTRVHRVTTLCRSGQEGAGLPRWGGYGISARRMAGIPARCLRS
jgi:hypothetical protein